MTQLLIEPNATHTTDAAHGFAASYLRFCSEHLAELDERIAKHDLAGVSRIAHTLTGNARLLGLSELSSLGKMLEDYCLGRDWGAITSAFEAIADTVGKLCDGPPVHVAVEIEPDDEPREFVVSTGGKRAGSGNPGAQITNHKSQTNRKRRATD
jgi:HPt (histidine-containing phosphotransfer) domain-containing protein